VMNVVPAQVAGVGSIAVFSPAQKDFGGRPHPTILAACALLGVEEVYAVGGAQAIGLAAYGDAELGIEPEMLDTQSHELVLDGHRVKLTKLEFEVFRYLYTRKGTAVSRASLVEDVWGWKHTGSNVIEAVMRTLRKKLGDKSESIETIRGLGYRFRNSS